MSKITIATAVLAGLAITDRLNELEVRDQELTRLVGDLASSLGAIMSATESVDAAVGVVARAQLAGDEDTVMEGLAKIKGVTTGLVSDQDKIMEAMLGELSDEEAAILQLMSALSALSR